MTRNQKPDDVAYEMTRYPPAEISPAEFEEFVVGILRSMDSKVANLKIRLHEIIEGVDGAYDMDATMNFEMNGMLFRVLVEAKRHANPIKREIVQILHQKVLSTGAHKGLIVSTAPFQRGALDFAKIHGIALVTLTEGRFTYMTKSADPPPPMSREVALQRGIPTFVGHAYRASPNGGGTRVTRISTRDPDYLLEVLLETTPPLTP